MCVGSFLAALSSRLKKGEKIVFDRSKCDSCKRLLKWYELIPLLSFVWMKGKCRTCKQNIPPSFLLIEIFTAVVFFLLFITHPIEISVWYLVKNLVIASLLIFIGYHDWKYQEIYEKSTILPGLLLFISVLVFSFEQSLSFLFAVIAGGGFFLTQYILSRKQWVGRGDIGLGFLMGAILGWPAVYAAIVVSYVLGTLFLLPSILLKKKTMQSKISLGTFLCLGTLILMIWGETILQWYQ